MNQSCSGFPPPCFTLYPHRCWGRHIYFPMQGAEKLQRPEMKDNFPHCVLFFSKHTQLSIKACLQHTVANSLIFHRDTQGSHCTVFHACNVLYFLFFVILQKITRTQLFLFSACVVLVKRLRLCRVKILHKSFQAFLNLCGSLHYNNIVGARFKKTHILHYFFHLTGKRCLSSLSNSKRKME